MTTEGYLGGKSDEGKTLLNIGLAASEALGGKPLTHEEVLAALKEAGADVMGWSEHASDTEPTMVVRLRQPLSPEAGHKLSEALKQEAIAQLAPHGGELFGPMAEAWSPFNPEFFLNMEGRRASDTSFAQPAYHGTPHRFDKFSTDKIGTGEGAQAFGWGLYFTSKKGIAEHYREVLSRAYPDGFTKDGKTLETDADLAEAYFSPGRVVQGYGGADKVLKFERNDRGGWSVQVVHVDGEGNPERGERPRWHSTFPDKKPLEAALKAEGWEKRKGGQLYEAEVPESSEMLHWDKPLSEQPEKVREALAGEVTDRFEKDRASAWAWAYPDSGKGLYASLRATYGSDKAASEALMAAGIKGIDYPAQSLSGGAKDDARNFVVFSGDDVAIKNQFYQGEQQAQPESRGVISLGGFPAKPATITLLEKANLSTYLHELGHFFLETYTHIADSPDAPPKIARDMQTILDSFGIKDVATWRAMGLEERRPFHEQFARSYEAYLMEGKAPTIAQQSMFARFSAWLTKVYQSIQSLGVTLTPEVRGVMDRMTGSERAIAQAEQVRGMTRLFDTKPEGMTDEAWQTYLGDDAQASASAVSDMQARSLRDMKWFSNAKSKAMRALQRQARTERETIREQVTKEVDAYPAFAAKAELDKLTKKNADGTKPTVDFDLVAEAHGYANGDEMLRAISDAGSRSDAIEARTDQRMLEEHGELTDPESIERAAEAAIHNRMRAKVLATEFAALAKATGSASLLAKAASEAARVAIGAKRVKDLRPLQYQVAEGRSGKASMDAFRKDDIPGAAAQKRAQMLNNALAKHSADAVAEVDRIRKYVGRFDKERVLKKTGVEERGQILQVLANYDFRLNPSDEPTRAQRNLHQWLESQQMAGYTPLVEQSVLDAQPRTQYRDMTVDQVRELYDTVRSIEHIGKAKLQADWQGEKVALDDLVANVFIPKMQARGNNFTAEQLYSRPENQGTSAVRQLLDKLAAFRRASFAELKAQYFKSNHYDLHEILGPFHELIDGVIEANYRKIDMTRALSLQARELAAKLGKDWQKSTTEFVPNTSLIDAKATADTGQPVFMKLTRDNLIQMAAHAGNESNFDKLTKGYGWQPDALWRFLDGKLSAKDAEAVKAEWTWANQHWDETKAMYERQGQVAPPKIEPRPYKLRLDDGTTVDMPGGYMPIRYDPLRSRLGEKRQAERAIDPESGRFGYDFFGRDTTSNGSMNARVDGYTDAVDLSHSTFERALAETIHDLAYRESLVNFNKIITNKAFRDQFLKTYGREDYDALHTWLGRIANSENMDRQVGAMGTVLRYTRTGMVMNAIALRVSTVLKHGGSAAIKTMGYFVGGGEKFYAARQAAMAIHYKDEMAEAIEKFPEIRARALQQDRDYRETVSSLFNPDSLQGKAERFGHAAVAWADLFTATATAHAAYDRAVAEGIPKDMGGTGAPMTHEQAVRYANQIVREAHGSQIETARSNLMTNPHEGVKMFTTLYGFMNNTFGQVTDTVSKMRTVGINRPETLARAFMALIVPGMWAGILTHGVPTKDDWDKWLLQTQSAELMGMIPFARDLYSFFEGYRHAGVIGAESWMQSVAQPIVDTWKTAQGSDVHGKISHLADAVGMGLHIPGLGQLGKTAQYLWDVHTGRQQPASKGQLVEEALLGTHGKHN